MHVNNKIIQISLKLWHQFHYFVGKIAGCNDNLVLHIYEIEIIYNTKVDCDINAEDDIMCLLFSCQSKV